MKRNTPPVSEALVQTAQRALETRAGHITGLQLALFATFDGFEIACLRSCSDLQTERLSAMSSALMAMARSVGREIQSPPCKRLVFEASGSTVVFQSVETPTPCILCLVLGSNAVLGHALWAANEVVQSMSPSHI